MSATKKEAAEVPKQKISGPARLGQVARQVAELLEESRVDHGCIGIRYEMREAQAELILGYMRQVQRYADELARPATPVRFG